jgi:hypothetical protein
MADNVHRYGFRWYGGQHNSCPKGREYPVADTYQATIDGGGTSVDLRIGDPVKLVSDGSVALANTTDIVFGIVVGVAGVWVSADSAMRPRDRVPGGTTGGGLLDRQTRVLVVPAKQGLWEIDVNDVVTATTEAAYRAFVNENVEHVCTGDVTNSTQPKADPRISISSHAVTAGHGWRIVGISKTVENRDFSGANVKIVVQVNDSNEAGSATAATTVVGV